MTTDNEFSEPPLQRDQYGRVDVDSVPDVIQWFLENDQRVGIMRHPRVEEVFQWKQRLGKSQNEDIFIFDRAEDRLAIGIIQALAEHPTERDLHDWIGQLLNALDKASKANEATAQTYRLNLRDTESVVAESGKIPFQRGRQDFLLNCWIETLCTAEARVLGWLYLEFYGKPFAP